MENNQKVKTDGLLEFVPLMVKINDKAYITSEELARIFDEEHSLIKKWVVEFLAFAEERGHRKRIKKDFLRRKTVNKDGEMVDSYFISGEGFFYMGHHFKNENTSKDKILSILTMIQSFSYVRDTL